MILEVWKLILLGHQRRKLRTISNDYFPLQFALQVQANIMDVALSVNKMTRTQIGIEMWAIIELASDAQWEHEVWKLYENFKCVAILQKKIKEN
mmetsp:Transcript_5964/g.8332  ORF Transcript_5964/g.8332 Transcript_5964/m.8332 type:complete len:94 (-) Transcript_5964:428-709(-)